MRKTLFLRRRGLSEPTLSTTQPDSESRTSDPHEAGLTSPLVPSSSGSIRRSLESLSRLSISRPLDGLYRRASLSSRRRTERQVLLPPIHRLPFDVHARILHQCALHEPSSIVAISHIDTRFRRTAFSCPLLWSKIALCGPPSLPKAKAFLQRSQPCPTDITLRFITDKTTDVLLYVQHVHAFREVFQEMILHKDRWRTLHIDIRDYDVMAYVLNSMPSDIPLLERIALRCRTGRKQGGQEDPALQIFQGGMPPRLKHVEFNAINARWDTPFVRDLESLRIVRSSQRPETVAHFFNTLRASPGLRRLHLELLQSEPQLQANEAVDLGLLDSLVLCKIEPDTLGRIFSSFRLPRLRHLELEFTSSSRNLSLADLVTAGGFTLPSLVTLGLANCGLPADVVFALLRRTTTIKKLRISGGSLAHPLLLALSSSFYEAGHGWLLPQLEALQVKRCETLTGGSILNLVRNRHHSVATTDIITVWIADCPQVDAELIGQLAEFGAAASVVQA